MQLRGICGRDWDWGCGKLVDNFFLEILLERRIIVTFVVRRWYGEDDL